MFSHPPSSGHRVSRNVVLILALGAGAASSLAGQGVRYSLAPAVHHIRWDDQIGLEKATMVGGRLGATFGDLLSLEGYYFTRNGIETEFGRIGLLGPGGGSLSDQDVNIRHFGADLRIRLGSGSFAPFATAGAGVLQLEPDLGVQTDLVVLKYGAGVKFQLAPGVEGQLYGENARFRLDRYRLAIPGALPFPADPDAGKTRNNWAFGAGLGLALGSSGRGSGRDRWSLASIPIEPFVGRLDFDDEALGNQWLVGVRTGIDFGNYVGLRAYYWRAVEDDFNDFERLQSYGGEFQFNFNANRGPAPYLIAGAGRLDFRPGFADTAGASRTDRTMVIGGAGLGLRLTDRFRLNVAVRDFIYADADLVDVATTSELRHNVMASAGITFAIGRDRTRAPQEDRDAARRPDRVDDDDPDAEAPSRRIDRTRPERDDTAWTDTTRRARHRDRDDRATRRRPADPADYVSDQTATFPVPREGEIYIRYGKPGSERLVTMSADSTRLVVRADTAASRVVTLDSIGEARLIARLDSLAAARTRADSARVEGIIREALRDLPRQPIAAAPNDRITIVEPRTTTESSLGTSIRVRSPSVYSGFSIDNPRQFVIGGLLDFHRSDQGGWLRFLPEVAFGFGDGGTTVLLAGNVAGVLPTLELGRTTTVTPRARAGLGVMIYSGDVDGGRDTQGVLNFAYGFATNLIDLGVGKPVLFFEHQGIDLFNNNRLVVGLQWNPGGIARR